MYQRSGTEWGAKQHPTVTARKQLPVYGPKINMTLGRHYQPRSNQWRLGFVLVEGLNQKILLLARRRSAGPSLTGYYQQSDIEPWNLGGQSPTTSGGKAPPNLGTLGGQSPTKDSSLWYVCSGGAQHSANAKQKQNTQKQPSSKEQKGNDIPRSLCRE